MSQSLQLSHAESIANSIIGAGLSQLVLWLFGVPIVEALWLNMAMIFTSYGRSFILRRVFARMK